MSERPTVRFETSPANYLAVSSLPYGIKKEVYNQFTEVLVEEIKANGFQFVGELMDGKVKIKVIRDEH